MTAQYQVRIHDRPEGEEFVYAPRDNDRYVKRAPPRRRPVAEDLESPPTIQTGRVVSQRRQYLRLLEGSLHQKPDVRKQRAYEQLQQLHNSMMSLVVQDMLVHEDRGRSTRPKAISL